MLRFFKVGFSPGHHLSFVDFDPDGNHSNQTGSMLGSFLYLFVSICSSLKSFFTHCLSRFIIDDLLNSGQTLLNTPSKEHEQMNDLSHFWLPKLGSLIFGAQRLTAS